MSELEKAYQKALGDLASDLYDLEGLGNAQYLEVLNVIENLRKNPRLPIVVTPDGEDHYDDESDPIILSWWQNMFGV